MVRHPIGTSGSALNCGCCFVVCVSLILFVGMCVSQQNIMIV